MRSRGDHAEASWLQQCIASRATAEVHEAILMLHDIFNPSFILILGTVTSYISLKGSKEIEIGLVIVVYNGTS